MKLCSIIEKRNNCFAVQIIMRIFANGNCRSGAKQCAPLDIVIIRYVNIWRYTMTLPNETTLSAMKEAESGEDAGIVNIDSVESFIASMI